MIFEKNSWAFTTCPSFVSFYSNIDLFFIKTEPQIEEKSWISNAFKIWN